MISFWNYRLKFALRLSFSHFVISLLVGGLTAVLVFLLWYPSPFRGILGVGEIYFIILIVDVVCGPLLTFVLSDPGKSRKELLLDLSLVALIQLAALIYGLYSVGLGRPVAVMMEKDRFVIVTAADVSGIHLQKAKPPFNEVPLFSILYAGTREPTGSEEFMQSLELSMQGVSPSMRADWWISYEDSKDAIKKRAKKLKPLYNELDEPEQTALDSAVNKSGHRIQDLYYLPLVSHTVMDWSVLLDSNYEIVTFVHLNGF